MKLPQILTDLHQIKYISVGWFNKHSYKFFNRSIENLIFYKLIIFLVKISTSKL